MEPSLLGFITDPLGYVTITACAAMIAIEFFWQPEA